MANKPDTIILGIDNLGVSRSLLRGVSASIKADPFIQDTIDTLLPIVNPQMLAMVDI